MEPDFYMRDPRALTRSVLADMNPCEYGRVTMLTDMSCEEYPFGVLEITLPALCKKWHMNAARAFRFLLKLRDEWKLISRIEGKDGPLRIELSQRALRRQAEGYDGRGTHDPIAQVQALSAEALLPPPTPQEQRDKDADRQAWKRFREEHPGQTFTTADRDAFMQQRRESRLQPQTPTPSTSPLPTTPVTPENTDVTPASEPPVTGSLSGFFADKSQPVTSRSLEQTTASDEAESKKENNNSSVTPASHAPEGVTSTGVTLPVTDALAEEVNAVVALLSDVMKPYALSVAVAQELVQKHGAAFCRQQLLWLPDRDQDEKKGSLAGMLRRSIEEKYNEPAKVQKRRDEAKLREQQRQEEERKRAAATSRAEAEQAERQALEALYHELSPPEREEVDAQARASLSDIWRGKVKEAEAELAKGGTPSKAAQMALDELTRVRRDVVRRRTEGTGGKQE